MTTISRGYTFGSTELLTSAKLHSLVDDATITGIDITTIGGGTASGDTIYYNGTAWTVLPIGTAGQTLTVNGSATAPEWA